MNTEYEQLRRKYRPSAIAFLLIAESPPPAAEVESSRQFYRVDRIRTNDRLFSNTIRALYYEAEKLPLQTLEKDKEKWLKRLQSDGIYMIEALETSLPHEVTKQQRQALIKKALPQLITRVGKLAGKKTKLILIKSNVFVVAAEPLCKAGFNVLNKELVDYPGQYNQKAYRDKLAALLEP